MPNGNANTKHFKSGPINGYDGYYTPEVIEWLKFSYEKIRMYAKNKKIP